MTFVEERIGKPIDLEELGKYICSQYQMGSYLGYKIIIIGIEDLSFYLYTTKQDYVVKVFNQNRSHENKQDYMKKYKIMIEHGIPCPKLLERNGNVISNYQNKIDFCVMECIQGTDLYTKDSFITKQQINKLITLVGELRKIEEKVECQYDEYLFLNIVEIYNKTKEKIPQWLRKKAEKLIPTFNKIDFSQFTKTYIHGDLNKSNVIESEQGELYLVDFSESGYSYMMVDIIAILNKTIFDYRREEESIALEKFFLHEYKKCFSLTTYEISNIELLQKCQAFCGLALKHYYGYHQESFWSKNNTAILERS